MEHLVAEVGSATTRDSTESPFLAVKFAVPAPPAPLVERRRLASTLDRGPGAPLTLVSAPAGSGKTTAVAAWSARRPEADRPAWVTLDKEDGRPGAVLPLVIECLRRHGVVLPAVGARVPPGDEEDMLDRVAAVLAQLSRPVTLVLDGFEHAARDAAGHLDTVARRSGGRLRLVVVTRVDPALPLARYRLSGTLVELRAADLAFTTEETARLVRRQGLLLGSDSVAALQARTRGWAAGLRFAAMYLSASEDPAQAVLRLAGDTGNIAEYLMSEVLQTVSPDVRRLLLRTSVVDVLPPGLVDELAGPSASRALALLAHANVLVEEVPDRPGWYRYHPLLRDLLRAELAFHAPEERIVLHRRAAAWLASNGRLEAAVRTACAVDAWEEASQHVVDDLALAQILTGDRSGPAQTLRQMPPSVLGPAAAAVRAAFALADDDLGGYDNAMAHLREDVTSDGAAAPAAVLAAQVLAAVRAGRHGDREAATLAERALGSLAGPPTWSRAEHPELIALLHLTKGSALLREGALNEARDTLTQVTAPTGSPLPPACEPLALAGLGHLALIACLRGELRQARDWATQMAALAARTGLSKTERPATGDVALAWLTSEHYELRMSAQHLASARRSTALVHDPVARVMADLVQARHLRARGDVAGALGHLERLEDVPDWLAAWVRAEIAALTIADGEPARAVGLLEDRPGPLGPRDAVMLGWAHAALGDWEAVQRTLDAPHPSDGAGSQSLEVDTRLLRVAVDLHTGQHARARAGLARCLRLAARETLRRPFRDAPASIRALLDTEVALASQNSWLGSSGGVGGRRTIPAPGRGQLPPEGTGAAPTRLIEPLTPKESEVLGHMSELLSTEEIAAAMFVSVNTIRTHVRNILRKLAVSRRNDAIRRARSLSLIGQ